MEKTRDEKLKKGLANLLGGAAAPVKSETSTASQLEPDTEQERKTAEMIETVSDEELKEKLRQRQLDGRGRPKRGRPHDSRTDGYGTICVKANLEKWEKIKVISLRETLQLKEVLELALDKLIAEYEAEKGEIALAPASKKGNVFNK